MPGVLLVGADDAARAALQETAATLASFGLASTFLAADDSPGDGLIPACLAVVVADPDGELSAWWARSSTRRPVLRVPVAGGGKQGLTLLQDVRGELPHAARDGTFGTLAIGAAGAKNAALFVVAILAVSDEELRTRWEAFRAAQTAAVLEGPALRLVE